MAINLDKDSLEKALMRNSAPKKANIDVPEMTREEEIGIHKGSLNTLAAERMELVKMLQNVEAIMQAHLKRLDELGVKIETRSE